MDFISTMRGKGITHTGAIQVALGRSLSSYADRHKLQQLALPVAKTSLSKPISTETITAGTTARLTPKQLAWRVMEATVKRNTSPVLKALWAQQRAQEQAAIAATKNEELQRAMRKMADQVEELRRQIERAAARAGNFWYAFCDLFFNRGPFWPWEWDEWHRKMGNVRWSLEDAEETVRKAAQDMDKAREKLMSKEA